MHVNGTNQAKLSRGNKIGSLSLTIKSERRRGPNVGWLVSFLRINFLSVFFKMGGGGRAKRTLFGCELIRKTVTSKRGRLSEVYLRRENLIKIQSERNKIPRWHLSLCYLIGALPKKTF